MFKKIKSVYLMIALIILLIVYFLVRYAGTNDRTFKDKVLSFDPASVTEVVIKDRSQPEEVSLLKTGNDWKVVRGGKQYNADTNVVKNILAQLSDLKTKRFAGKGKDAWVKYQVTDTSATIVKIASKDKIIAEVLIGKFSYNQPKNQQQQQQMHQQQQADITSYVRLADEKEVYAVDGFLKMNFNRGADNYRNRSLVNVDKADVSRIIFQYPGKNMTLENQGGKWMVNGLAADSTKTIKYLGSLCRLSSPNFVYDIVPAGTPGYEVTIEGNNFAPIQLSAYSSADTNIAFIITSSANDGAFFNGKKSDLFKKIMTEESNFLPE